MRTFYPTTPDDLERRAFDSGREIELSPTTAYLEVDGTVWYALLTEVGA